MTCGRSRLRGDRPSAAQRRGRRHHAEVVDVPIRSGADRKKWSSRVLTTPRCCWAAWRADCLARVKPGRHLERQDGLRGAEDCARCGAAPGGGDAAGWGERRRRGAWSKFEVRRETGSIDHQSRRSHALGLTDKISIGRRLSAPNGNSAQPLSHKPTSCGLHGQRSPTLWNNHSAH